MNREDYTDRVQLRLKENEHSDYSLLGYVVRGRTRSSEGHCGSRDCLDKGMEDYRR